MNEDLKVTVTNRPWGTCRVHDLKGRDLLVCAGESSPIVLSRDQAVVLLEALVEHLGFETVEAEEPAPAPTPARKPPFHWSPEDRAKLVPGSSFVFHPNLTPCNPHRVTCLAWLAIEDLDWIRTGEWGLVDPELCDPSTIAPPAESADKATEEARAVRRFPISDDPGFLEWLLGGTAATNPALRTV